MLSALTITLFSHVFEKYVENWIPFYDGVPRFKFEKERDEKLYSSNNESPFHSNGNNLTDSMAGKDISTTNGDLFFKTEAFQYKKNAERNMPSPFASLTTDFCIRQGEETANQETVQANLKRILNTIPEKEKFDDINRVKLRELPKYSFKGRKNCTERSFSETHLPLTALTSIAGSGNTWSRHLIEHITGK